MTAWLFPGQGSQRPGMAKDVEECKELFAVAQRVLGADLESLCTSETVEAWPAELLQPAIFTTSVGLALGMRARGTEPEAVLGHSLGDFAALVTAGIVDFEHALRLVDVRGRAMAAAGRKHSGGMAAVIGLDVATIGEICEEVGQIWVANLNGPAQTVVSGKDKSLARSAGLFLEAGAARVVRLKVPVAAHTPFMESAAEALATEVEAIEFKAPSCAFYSTVDAQSHNDPTEIAKLLVESVTHPVRFAEALIAMTDDGIDDFVEVGPGRALRGLVRQTLPNYATAAAADR